VCLPLVAYARTNFYTYAHGHMCNCTNTRIRIQMYTSAYVHVFLTHVCTHHTHSHTSTHGATRAARTVKLVRFPGSRKGLAATFIAVKANGERSGAALEHRACVRGRLGDVERRTATSSLCAEARVRRFQHRRELLFPVFHVGHAEMRVHNAPPSVRASLSERKGLLVVGGDVNLKEENGGHGVGDSH